MKTVKSFGIYFNVRLEKEKDGKARVYMCITVEGKKTWVALQQKITLKCWDMGRGIGKNSTAEAKTVNAYLDELRQTVNDCYKELQLKRRVITADAIKASFLCQDDEERTLQDIFQYHNDMAASVLAKATMKNYYTTQRYLEVIIIKQISLDEDWFEPVWVRFETCAHLRSNLFYNRLPNLTASPQASLNWGRTLDVSTYNYITNRVFLVSCTQGTQVTLF